MYQLAAGLSAVTKDWCLFDKVCYQLMCLEITRNLHTCWLKIDMTRCETAVFKILGLCDTIPVRIRYSTKRKRSSLACISEPTLNLLNLAGLTFRRCHVSYPPEAPELQIRKMADLCFLVQHYELAYSCYHTAKKDFLSDQAMLYAAGALVRTDTRTHTHTHFCTTEFYCMDNLFLRDYDNKAFESWMHLMTDTNLVYHAITIYLSVQVHAFMKTEYLLNHYLSLSPLLFLIPSPLSLFVLFCLCCVFFLLPSAYRKWLQCQRSCRLELRGHTQHTTWTQQYRPTEMSASMTYHLLSVTLVIFVAMHVSFMQPAVFVVTMFFIKVQCFLLWSILPFSEFKGQFLLW